MKFILTLILLPQILWAMPSKDEQFKISLQTVIDNSTKKDVMPGMVVASPSRENPDYYYDWVRDTALTMRSMIDFWEISKDPKIKSLILTWVDAETYRQKLPTLSGLGEPKYNIDGSGYRGPWGRPQNDGPALRALAMVKFARLLIQNGEVDYVLKNLYHGTLRSNSVIKNDLEYTAHNWQKPSFDLWEEELGMHFYTLLAQHTALQEGSKLAYDLGDKEAAQFYAQQSAWIAEKLKHEFLDERVGILVSTVVMKKRSLGYKNSKIDVAPLLALLHNSPFQRIFSPNHPAVRKYIDVLIRYSIDSYPINKAYPDLGIAVGRYPEDRYNGYHTDGTGNPWFLSTLGLGEYYCMLRNQTKNNKINVLVEKQFQRALFHSDRKGRMDEQFNLQTGSMQGALELTWSHNAFMTAMMRCGLVR